jgi:hypothetical protein
MVECERCRRKFGTYAALRQHYTNQHSNAKWTDGLERKLVEEKEVQVVRTAPPFRKSHTRLVVALVLLAVVFGAALLYLPSGSNLPPSQSNSACAGFPFQSIVGQTLAAHYHALLLMYVNDQKVIIPDNVGDGDSGPCTQPLHVHASDPGTDVIHIETPTSTAYTIGGFFKVWAATPGIGGPTPVIFNMNQLFGNKVGNGYELRMYVNGQQLSQYDSLTLQDHMVIVIVYGGLTTNWGNYQNMSAQTWPYSNL